MDEPVITLTTDFGEASPYVASMKGVILGINAAARLLDLSHAIPPQNVRHTAFFLASAIPCFPTSAIHVVVIDPGVGTARDVLYVEVGGHRLVAPDNGCWTKLARECGGSPLVRRLENSQYWRQPISDTFHGRDILAPVAAHLSLGADPAQLGAIVSRWVKLPEAKPERRKDGVTGEIDFVDDFGNLITNIPAMMLGPIASGACRIEVGSREILRLVRTYGEAAPGELLGLVSSGGMLEIAVNQGSAARMLQVGAGTAVRVSFKEPR
jgi:S-adenosylmethionine hydrolase